MGGRDWDAFARTLEAALDMTASWRDHLGRKEPEEQIKHAVRRARGGQ